MTFIWPPYKYYVKTLGTKKTTDVISTITHYMFESSENHLTNMKENNYEQT